ncbi:MAG TPA: ABC transporter substrate-binding protein [Acidimicrobiales bacterium]
MKLRQRRSFRAFVALVAAAALLATACSSDDGDEGSSPTTQPTEAVNRDGTLSMGYDLIQNGQWSWNPAVGSSGTSMDPMWYLVYGRLMRKAPDGTLTPDQAESAEIVDANTIEVKIRPDQTWQDGAPFDADSVKAGLDSNIASKNQGNLGADYSGTGGATVTVDVVDTLTVKINVPNGAAPQWLEYLADVGGTIVRPGTEPKSAAPVGAGPFKVSEYSPETLLTLERYDGFWNAEEVNFAKIGTVSTNQSQPQVATAALQSGQADIVTFDTTQLSTLSGDLKEVVVSDPNRLVRMAFCKRDEPLSNVDLRTAISLAIDREALNEAIYAGTGSPATQFWPEGDRFYNPEVGDAMGYDLEGAKQAVADSGIANPTFDLYLLGSFNMPDVGTVVKEQLAQVGITANLIVTSNFVVEFLEPQKAGATFFPPTPTPGSRRLQSVVGQNLGNLCGYVNPELERLASELSKVSTQSDEAQQIWWQIDQIVADEALVAPILFASIIGGYNESDLVLNGTYNGGAWVIPDIYTSYMK